MRGIGTAPIRNVPGFAAGAGRRFWRWTEPHDSLGVSSSINYKSLPDHETSNYDYIPEPWAPPATRPETTSRSTPTTPAVSMLSSVTAACTSSGTAPAFSS